MDNDHLAGQAAYLGWTPHFEWMMGLSIAAILIGSVLLFLFFIPALRRRKYRSKKARRLVFPTPSKD